MGGDAADSWSPESDVWAASAAPAPPSDLASPPHHDDVPPLRPRREGRSQPVGHELGDGPRQDGYRTSHLDGVGSALPATEPPDDPLAAPAAFGRLAPWAPGAPAHGTNGHHDTGDPPDARNGASTPEPGPVDGRPDAEPGQLPQRRRGARAGGPDGANGSLRPHADEVAASAAGPAGHNGSAASAEGTNGVSPAERDSDRPWWQIFGATVPGARAETGERAIGSAATVLPNTFCSARAVSKTLSAARRETA